MKYRIISNYSNSQFIVQLKRFKLFWINFENYADKLAKQKGKESCFQHYYESFDNAEKDLARFIRLYYEFKACKYRKHILKTGTLKDEKFLSLL